MSDEPFKPGDVVRLKAGYVKMTVAGKTVQWLNYDRIAVECVWMNANNELQTAEIVADALEKCT